MAEVVVEIEVVCAKCNFPLDTQRATNLSGFLQTGLIEVIPCEACMRSAHEEGFEEAESQYETETESDRR